MTTALPLLRSQDSGRPIATAGYLRAEAVADGFHPAESALADFFEDDVQETTVQAKRFVLPARVR